ncbi:hypothetical protein QTO34_019352, partial [Cnephaeus nilssonii]
MGNKLTCCLKSNASPKLGQHSGWVNRDEESGVCVAGTRNSVAAPPAPTALEPAELNFQACVGRPVLYLGDLEMPKACNSKALAAEPPTPEPPNLYPHPVRLSLVRSGVEHPELLPTSRKLAGVSPGHRSAKYSSCSTIFLDDSTICHPNVRITMQCLALAIYYHIKNRIEKAESALITLLIVTALSKMFLSKAEFVFQQETVKNKMTTSYNANRSEDIFDERLHPFTQEIVPEEYFNHNPDSESIYRFIHPFFSATKLTAEWAIIALYLHDRALRNADFCQIFEGITVKDISPFGCAACEVNWVLGHCLKLAAECVGSEVSWEELPVGQCQTLPSACDWPWAIILELQSSPQFVAGQGLIGMHAKAKLHTKDTFHRVLVPHSHGVDAELEPLLATNDLERQYLHLLQFRLNVSASVYAKYYFDLRSLASDHGLPVVFAPLRKERAQNLE